MNRHEFYDCLNMYKALEHKVSPLLGEQNPNAKYYKREGEPGNYRYYYSKEEYDAAHNQSGNAAAEQAKAQQQYQQQQKLKQQQANQNGSAKAAQQQAQAQQQYQEVQKMKQQQANQSGSAKAAEEQAKAQQEHKVQQYTKVAQEKGPEAAAKEYMKDDSVTSLLGKIENGLKSGKLSYKDGQFQTKDANLQKEIESAAGNIQNVGNKIGQGIGSGDKVKKEIEKLVTSEVDKLNNGRSQEAENAGKAQQKYNETQKAKKESASQSGRSKEADSQGNDYQRYLDEQKAKKESASQSGRSNEAEESGKAQDAYKLRQKQIREAKQRVAERTKGESNSKAAEAEGKGYDEYRKQQNQKKTSKEYDEETEYNKKRDDLDKDLDKKHADLNEKYGYGRSTENLESTLKGEERKRYIEDRDKINQEYLTSIQNLDKKNASKEYNEEISGKSASKSESNNDWKERQDKMLDDAMKSGANLKDLSDKYGMSEEYIQELVYNVTGKTLKNEEKKPSNAGSAVANSMSKEYEEEKKYNSKKNKY